MEPNKTVRKSRTPLSSAGNYLTSSTREQHILDFEKEITRACSFPILFPLLLLLFHCEKVMNANVPRRLVKQQFLNVGRITMLLQADKVEGGRMKHTITIKTGYIKNYDIYFTM